MCVVVVVAVAFNGKKKKARSRLLINRQMSSLFCFNLSYNREASTLQIFECDTRAQ